MLGFNSFLFLLFFFDVFFFILFLYSLYWNRIVSAYFNCFASCLEDYWIVNGANACYNITTEHYTPHTPKYETVQITTVRATPLNFILLLRAQCMPDRSNETNRVLDGFHGSTRNSSKFYYKKFFSLYFICRFFQFGVSYCVFQLSILPLSIWTFRPWYKHNLTAGQFTFR